MNSLHVPLYTTPPTSKKRIRIVAISDTHTKHNLIEHLPAADILLHCGDFANRCKTDDHIIKFNEWLGQLKQYRYKIVIAGNQEYIFNKMTREQIQKRLLTNCIYLQDSGCTVEGIKFWGSPWQSSRNMAFSFPRDQLYKKWDLIPSNIDILMTHMPPKHILDKTSSGKHWGSSSLREKVLKEIKPKVHVFGHVHEGYGYEKIGDVMFINAASTPWPELKDKQMRDPVVFDFYV